MTAGVPAPAPAFFFNLKNAFSQPLTILIERRRRNGSVAVPGRCPVSGVRTPDYSELKQVNDFRTGSQALCRIPAVMKI